MIQAVVYRLAFQDGKEAPIKIEESKGSIIITADDGLDLTEKSILAAIEEIKVENQVAFAAETQKVATLKTSIIGKLKAVNLTDEEMEYMRLFR